MTNNSRFVGFSQRNIVRIEQTFHHCFRNTFINLVQYQVAKQASAINCRSAIPVDGELQVLNLLVKQTMNEISLNQLCYFFPCYIQYFSVSCTFFSCVIFNNLIPLLLQFVPKELRLSLERKLVGHKISFCWRWYTTKMSPLHVTLFRTFLGKSEFKVQIYKF